MQHDNEAPPRTADESLARIAAAFDGAPAKYALGIVDAVKLDAGVQWVLLVWRLAEGIESGEVALVPGDTDLSGAICAALDRAATDGPGALAARVISDAPERVAAGDAAVAFAIASRHEAAGVPNA